MSVEAITWALRQPIQHSSAKFVLVVLANCASAENAHAFPSVAYLSAAFSMERRNRKDHRNFFAVMRFKDHLAIL